MEIKGYCPHDLHRLCKIISRITPEYPAGKYLFLLYDNAAPRKTKYVNEFLKNGFLSLTTLRIHLSITMPLFSISRTENQHMVTGAFYDDIAAIQIEVTDETRVITLSALYFVQNNSK